MKSLADFDVAGLGALLRQWGFKPSHAARLLRAYFDASGRPDLDARETGGALRERLRREFPLRRSRVITTRRSADGTLKLLVGFDGTAGGAVETVLMPGYRA